MEIGHKWTNIHVLSQNRLNQEYILKYIIAHLTYYLSQVSDCHRGVVIDGLDTMFTSSMTTAANIVLRAINNRKYIYAVTLKFDYESLKEKNAIKAVEEGLCSTMFIIFISRVYRNIFWLLYHFKKSQLMLSCLDGGFLRFLRRTYYFLAGTISFKRHGLEVFQS